MFKRLLAFAVGSVMSQGLAALTGLLLAHWLPMADYALYTVMILLTGAMTILTKGGTHLGYTILLSRDWGNPTKVDADGKAIKAVRKQISSFMMPPIILTAVILLHKNGADYLQIFVLCVFLCLLWFSDMQTRVIDQALFFAHQTTRVQVLDFALSFLRLILTVIIKEVNLLGAVLSIGISVIISALRVPVILHWVKNIIPATRSIPPNEDFELVRNTALRQLPVELFTVFQVQIVILLLSFFADYSGVAEYGALSRIPQLLLPIQALSYAFCIPAFSRMKGGILSALFMYTGICAIPAIALVIISWAFPSYILMLIGPNYAHLEGELLIATINAAFFSVAQIFWNLVAHRGWNKFAWFQIPIGVSWCITAPLFLPIHTLGGVLWVQAGFSVGYIVSAAADLIAAKRRGLL